MTSAAITTTTMMENTHKHQKQQQQVIEQTLQLTTITRLSDLQELRDLYRKDWPEHCVGFYTLDNFIRWLQREPEMKNLLIYTLNDDWRSAGLFLIVDRYQLFLNSLHWDKDNKLLTKALSLLNWTTGYKVSSFLERHRSAVVSVVKELNLAMEYDSLTLLYYMSAAKASQLNVDCPPGFALRPMNPFRDAAVVDELWPNRHQGSLFVLQRLIAWNINVGVYVENSNELVAWCLRWFVGARLQGGFLGALQVKDSHKRLGLGSLVTRATSRRLASELGHDVMALVNKDNLPSCHMFDKLGFKVTDKAYWLRTYPTVEGQEWPDGE